MHRLVVIGFVIAILLFNIQGMSQSLAAESVVSCSESMPTVVIIPEWVRDRQQYEPSYRYVPMELSVMPESEPMWVRDRQQYEPSYQPLDAGC